MTTAKVSDPRSTEEIAREIADKYAAYAETKFGDCRPFFENLVSAALTSERERGEVLERDNKRLRGSLEYILAQARQGYPTALSVIKANAAAALDDNWQKTVKDALAHIPTEAKP